jgi:hypothetical protein
MDISQHPTPQIGAHKHRTQKKKVAGGHMADATHPEQAAEEGLVLLRKSGIAQLVRQEDTRGQNHSLDGLTEPSLERLLAGQVGGDLKN